MADKAEHDAMRQALAAASSVPRTLPNPPVGCVIVDNSGTVVAEGVHHGAGTAHAEVDALSKLPGSAAGLTAVVTLEPCAHQGRTGPCADALIEAGIARVVYGAADPNPLGAGGAERLRAAGVEVESGVLADEASELIEFWAFRFSNKRPFVTWKYAATLDGLSAAPDGSSKWITGAEARADVHRFRAQCDAIVAGTGAVLADDPRLTVRDENDHPLPRQSQALRVIVGETKIPSYYRVFDSLAETLVIETRDIAEVMSILYERGIHHVWLEGGPRLAGAMWNEGVIDRVIGYIAPAMLGSGRAALEGEATTLADIRPIDLSEVTMVGSDIRIIGRPGRMPREDFD